MRRLILWLALPALIYSPAEALTLDQAVSDALQYNPRIQQFLALEDAADARASSSEAPFWPRIEADYTYWRQENDPDLDSRKLSRAFSAPAA